MDDQIKPKRKRIAREVEYYLSVQPDAPSYALIPKSKTPAGQRMERMMLSHFVGQSRRSYFQNLERIRIAENPMWPERQNVSEAIAQYIHGKAQQNPETVRRQLMGDWKV